MSVNSKISIITIISWVLGSGLIAFSANTIYDDFINQANLSIDIQQVNATTTKNLIDTDITISNSGMQTANNVRLTLESLNGAIIKPYLVLTENYYNEELTIEKINNSIVRDRFNLFGNNTSDIKNSTWIIKISNITSQGSVTLKALSIPQNETMNLYSYLRYDSGYSSASVKVGKDFEKPVYSNPLLLAIINSSSLFLIAGVLFISPYLYKKLKGLLDKRNKTKFILNIINEIYTIKQSLEGNRKSEKVYFLEIWNSKDVLVKQKIINDYHYYVQIEEFYNELMNRDKILKDSIIHPSKKLIEQNEKIIRLADTLFKEKSIKWTNYQIRNKKTNLILTVLLIIIGSVAIFVLDFFIYLTIFPPLAYSLGDILKKEILVVVTNYIILIILIMSRGIVGYLISLIIAKFYLLSTNNIIMTKDSISRLSLSKNFFLKGLVLSFIILGISDFYLTNFNLFMPHYPFLAINIGGILNPLILVIEILRLSLLTFLIQRYLIKTSKVIWPIK